MKSNNNLIIINKNQLIIIVSCLLMGATFDPERQDKSKVKCKKKPKTKNIYFPITKNTLPSAWAKINCLIILHAGHLIL